MTSTEQHTQSTIDSIRRQGNQTHAQQPLRSVRQDNPSPPPDPPASPQPALLQKHHREQQLNNKTVRVQNRRTRRKSSVKITSWVKPVIKNEIAKLAYEEGLSISALSASLLEKALQHSLYLRYAALIDPIIQKAIGKHIRSYSSRIALLLVRVAYASEQTRSIVTNVLSRQPGVTPSELNQLLDRSSQSAKGKITQKTPQLRDVLAEIEKWFQREEE